MNLIKKRKHARLMVLFTASLGCTFATLSGTLAAFAYASPPAAEAGAQPTA